MWLNSHSLAPTLQLPSFTNGQLGAAYLESIKDHVAIGKYLARNKDRGHGNLTEADYNAIRRIQRGLKDVELPQALKRHHSNTPDQEAHS